MLSGSPESQLYSKFTRSPIIKSPICKEDGQTLLLVVRLMFIIVSVDTVSLHFNPWYVTWSSQKVFEGQPFLHMLFRNLNTTLRGKGTWSICFPYQIALACFILRGYTRI